MKDIEAEFEIGDWILLKKEALVILSKNFTQNKIYIENYRYPQQVLSIITKLLMDGTTGIFYETIKGQKIRGRDFRIATEKEKKEQEIRNKFIIK
jgi:hypothetical protein